MMYENYKLSPFQVCKNDFFFVWKILLLSTYTGTHLYIFETYDEPQVMRQKLDKYQGIHFIIIITFKL